jgi:hypothetical protein
MKLFAVTVASPSEDGEHPDPAEIRAGTGAAAALVAAAERPDKVHAVMGSPWQNASAAFSL